MIVAPAGTVVDARVPAALMRPFSMTMTLSLIGAPPLPSTSIAPVMAVTLVCDETNVDRAAHRQIQTIAERMRWSCYRSRSVGAHSQRNTLDDTATNTMPAIARAARSPRCANHDSPVQMPLRSDTM